ncbi:MAG: hypothetical protein LAP21_21265 [Acidobacteriia bacterium]|nr:hypothetical protein [Terriglobia bacterium]
MKIRVLMAVAVLLACAGPAWCVVDATSAFTALKGLAGQWEGTVEGQPQVITWKLVSGGSAMMEEMDHESMVSMYHMDDNRLIMTHYCSAQNQPRMAADVSADGKTITFSFIDGTNLSKPHDAHMQKMVLTIQDENHMSEKWTFVQGGKEKTEVFELTRRK